MNLEPISIIFATNHCIRVLSKLLLLTILYYFHLKLVNWVSSNVFCNKYLTIFYYGVTVKVYCPIVVLKSTPVFLLENFYACIMYFLFFDKYIFCPDDTTTHLPILISLYTLMNWFQLDMGIWI